MRLEDGIKSFRALILARISDSFHLTGKGHEVVKVLTYLLI